jgi:hypothetical protein
MIAVERQRDGRRVALGQWIDDRVAEVAGERAGDRLEIGEVGARCVHAGVLRSERFEAIAGHVPFPVG